jgi:hypothetical protein
MISVLDVDQIHFNAYLPMYIRLAQDMNRLVRERRRSSVFCCRGSIRAKNYVMHRFAVG